MKPGYKTTEFWLTTAAVIASTCVTLLPIDSPGGKIAAAFVAGLAAIGYTVSRTAVKVNDA